MLGDRRSSSPASMLQPTQGSCDIRVPRCGSRAILAHVIPRQATSRLVVTATVSVLAFSIGCSADCSPCEANLPINTVAASATPETAAPTTTVDACSEARSTAEHARRVVEVLERNGLEFVAAAVESAEAELLDAYPDAAGQRVELARERAGDEALDEWTRSAEFEALKEADVDRARAVAEALVTCDG